MEFPLQIHRYLQTVYEDYSADGDSEVDNMVKLLQECIKKLSTDDIEELSKLATILDSVRGTGHALMSSSASNRGVRLRRIYTDSCITQCLLELMRNVTGPRESVWNECIQLLDGAIVFSGAPDRMEIVQRLIRYIQYNKLATTCDLLGRPSPRPVSYEVAPPPCGGMVPRIEEPNMISFLTTWCKVPFVISGGVAHWPALTTRAWDSVRYLKSVAGRGRMVPVEIGKDYRLDNWGQEMMDWEHFLEKVDAGAEPLVYLAQHSLLAQFPELREDINVPDFVYYSPATDYERYSPPANDDGLIINAWLGPKGTTSPAHQVSRWLAH
jgi:lysine-specific demethylase 8